MWQKIEQHWKMNVKDAWSRFTQPLICLSVADWCLNEKTFSFVAVLFPLMGKQIPIINLWRTPRNIIIDFLCFLLTTTTTANHISHNPSFQLHCESSLFLGGINNSECPPIISIIKIPPSECPTPRKRMFPKQILMIFVNYYMYEG